MPKSIATNAGDSLQSLAQQYLGDASQWRDIASLNNLNPLSVLQAGQELGIPLNSELISQAVPILTTVAQGLNGTAGIEAVLLEQATAAISKYVPEAQSLLGELNGVLSGDVESIVQRGLGELPSGLRQYKGEAVKLIDWLLQ